VREVVVNDAELTAAAALLQADVAFVQGANDHRRLMGESPAYSMDRSWESYQVVEDELTRRGILRPRAPVT
jgi:hypothetical protein